MATSSSMVPSGYPAGQPINPETVTARGAALGDVLRKVMPITTGLLLPFDLLTGYLIVNISPLRRNHGYSHDSY